MKYSWLNIENISKDEWIELCPVDEFRILSPCQLPNDIPQELKNKFDSVFIMASGTANGIVYYMANGNRVDFKAGTIDQEPFGLAFIGNSPTISGCLVHHGNWYNRTTKPPEEFWDYILCSGIGNCYPLTELPEVGSGNIADLKTKSQKDAFLKIVSKLKQFTEE